MSRKAPQAVPFGQVQINDDFWAPRIRTNREATLEEEYAQCKRTGRYDVWRWTPKAKWHPHVFWDSDVAKWIEACAYSLAAHPDKALEKKVDRWIADACRMQGKDGYLNSYFQQIEPDKRWSNLRDRHELYCAGHLMEAAVAWFETTGKRELLDAMCRYADYIAKVFGRGKGQKRGVPGHEEIELALVKLYRCTGEKRYLDLACFFVDERGQSPNYFAQEAEARGETAAGYGSGNTAPYAYYQAHQPVREQKTAEGHAVRAAYLYAGMADVAAETGDVKLKAACKRLWRNIVDQRMYVTGGIGSEPNGERFTFDYDLPNETAYAETCAAIALVFFAHRMLHLDGDGEYADVMERALYNNVLAGVSLDGTRFFYANRLAAHPEQIENRTHGFPLERQPWFDCACCPPNIARLFASLGQYVYSTRPGTILTHLYVGGSAKVEMGGQTVKLTQTTSYPFDEKVSLTVNLDAPAEFTFGLRLPGWCRKPVCNIGGKAVNLKAVTKKGYALLKRKWSDGDRVELILPMPVERIAAHPRLRQNAGRIALQRGPVVYCFEEVDNGADLNALILPKAAKVLLKKDKVLKVPVLSATGTREQSTDWKKTLYRPGAAIRKSAPIKAVPYYLWANRRPGEMLVWIRAE